MRVDVTKTAISFVMSDAAVARTIANGKGLLLDLDEADNVLALEIYDLDNADGLDEFAQEYDLEPLFDEIRQLARRVEESKPRDLNKKQSRKLVEIARRFATPAAA